MKNVCILLLTLFAFTLEAQVEKYKDRIYLKEGVYKCNLEILDYTISADKFDNITTKFEATGKIPFEIAFTSEKLVILFEKQNLKEEIFFDQKYEIIDNSIRDDGVITTSYSFYIKKWILKTNSKNEIIEEIKLDVRKPKKVLLTVMKNANAISTISCYDNFLSLAKVSKENKNYLGGNQIEIYSPAEYYYKEFSVPYYAQLAITIQF
jgi:hypothetical protein